MKYSARMIPDFSSKYLESQHTLRVFLPADADSTFIAYPVLYANDGQDFEHIGLTKTLENLVNSQQMRPIIVVAIFANAYRTLEYGVAGQPNAQGLGTHAGGYAQFLSEEVIPYIDSNYPTQAEPAGRAMMGWSLGGLSAFDMVWNHPDLFATAGVFSGSFWWSTPADSPTEIQDGRIAHRMVREGAYQPGLRFWFEAGTLDETADRDGNGVIDAIQDTNELIDELSLKGYQAGKDLLYVQVEGGRHNQETWVKVLPEFLKWAFPPNP